MKVKVKLTRPKPTGRMNTKRGKEDETKKERKRRKEKERKREREKKRTSLPGEG